MFNSSAPCIISSSKVFLFFLFVLVFHVGCYPQRSGNHLFTFKSKTCSSFFLIMTILHVCCLCDESNSSQFLPNFEPSVLKWEMGWVAAASYPDFQPIPLHLASACPSYPLLMAPGVSESGTSLESWGKITHYVLLIIYHFALMSHTVQ